MTETEGAVCTSVPEYELFVAATTEGETRLLSGKKGCEQNMKETMGRERRAERGHERHRVYTREERHRAHTREERGERREERGSPHERQSARTRGEREER